MQARTEGSPGPWWPGLSSSLRSRWEPGPLAAGLSLEPQNSFQTHARVPHPHVCLSNHRQTSHTPAVRLAQRRGCVCVPDAAGCFATAMSLRVVRTRRHGHRPLPCRDVGWNSQSSLRRFPRSCSPCSAWSGSSSPCARRPPCTSALSPHPSGSALTRSQAEAPVGASLPGVRRACLGALLLMQHQGEEAEPRPLSSRTFYGVWLPLPASSRLHLTLQSSRLCFPLEQRLSAFLTPRPLHTVHVVVTPNRKVILVATS